MSPLGATAMAWGRNGTSPVSASGTVVGAPGAGAVVVVVGFSGDAECGLPQAAAASNIPTVIRITKRLDVARACHQVERSALRRLSPTRVSSQRPPKDWAFLLSRLGAFPVAATACPGARHRHIPGARG